MRYFVIRAGLVMLALLGANPAQAQRHHGYAPPFTPAWAAPQLDLEPQVGVPGSTVRISGARFHKHVRVYYGDQPMPIVERGDHYIIAIVPRYVRGDDFIYVVDNTGRARTEVPFELAPSRRYARPDRYHDDYEGHDGYDRYERW